MRILTVFLFSIISFITFSSNDIDPKLEMRKLIQEIKQKDTSKILIGNGGIGIYYDNNGNIDNDFINVTDAVLVESAFYGYEGYNKKTPADPQKVFFNLVEPLKNSNKEILFLDYTDKKNNKKLKNQYLESNGYKGENALSKTLNSIYEPNEKSSDTDILNLKDINNFLILLNNEKFTNINEMIKALTYTSFDMIIIDPFFQGNLITKEQVEKLKIKPDGKQRKVIAYLSIGEAEDYRSYWNKEWNTSYPSWIEKENPDWKGNYIVKFWDSNWKTIIDKSQEEIISSGFDGYFLDTIDSYHYFEK